MEEKQKIINEHRKFFSSTKRVYEIFKRDIEILRRQDKYSQAIQISLTFIFIDFFSRIYLIFQGYRDDNLEKNNEQRFRGWCDSFILNENNELYKKHKGKISPNSKFLWIMRNSFLHFFSFPSRDKTGGPIVFSFNIEESQDEEILKELRKKHKHVNHINLYYLIDAVLDSYLCFHVFLIKEVDRDIVSYRKNLSYANLLLTKELASTIIVSKKDKKENSKNITP